MTRGAEELCELHREERDAAGALDQHVVAGNERGQSGQRTPRRQRGAGQRCGLEVGQVRRDVHEPVLGYAHDFGHRSVEWTAERLRETGERRLAGDPALEEARQTRSPTLTRVTPGPVSTTVPTPSETGISGSVPVYRP